MRTLPRRPGLRSQTQKRLRRQTAVILASPDPKQAAERRYASARRAPWFGEVIARLRAMAGPGEPCMWCDANEAGDVDHYRPKSVFPEKALLWDNLLWACAPCNRFKGNRFPPDTEPGARVLNPVEDAAWQHFFIDRFGTLTPVWRPDLNAFDPRAVSTREVLRLDRQALQERRLLRLKNLRTAVEDTLARFRANHITAQEVRDRIAQWKAEPFQADVADFFLSGPGRNEEPFATLLSLV